MKIVDTMAKPGRRRNTYSPEFKRKIVVACRQSGASVAGVALLHGINANVVRRWLRETPPVAPLVPAFIPLTFDSPARPAAAAVAPIRVELEQAGRRVTISWPVEAAGDCAAFVRSLFA